MIDIKMVNRTNMCLNQLCYIVYLDTAGNGLAQRIGSKIPKSCRTWIQKTSQKNKKCRLSFSNLFSDDVFDFQSIVLGQFHHIQYLDVNS